jgi:shikimate kinase
MTQSFQPETNLYLVGFMGTGKSTIGRAVAQRLGHEFLDSDHEIERLEEMTVPEIFTSKGEAHFRERELEFVEQGHPAKRTVVACGGGLVVQDGMLERLRQKGILICLQASLETVLKRTSTNQNRPLLQVDDPMQRIRDLYAQREPIYRQAGAVILTDHRPTKDIIAHVMRVYRRGAADWDRSSRSRHHAVKR